MAKATFAIGILIFAFQAKAQLDSSALWKKYEREVIYFSGVRYVKGDVRYRIKDLKNEFEFSPLGKEVYRMSRSDKRVSIVL